MERLAAPCVGTFPRTAASWRCQIAHPARHSVPPPKARVVFRRTFSQPKTALDEVRHGLHRSGKPVQLKHIPQSSRGFGWSKFRPHALSSSMTSRLLASVSQPAKVSNLRCAPNTHTAGIFLRVPTPESLGLASVDGLVAARARAGGGCRRTRASPAPNPAEQYRGGLALSFLGQLSWRCRGTPVRLHERRRADERLGDSEEFPPDRGRNARSHSATGIYRTVSCTLLPRVSLCMFNDGHTGTDPTCFAQLQNTAMDERRRLAEPNVQHKAAGQSILCRRRHW